MIRFFFILIACMTWHFSSAQKTLVTDVLVIGGGTGGTAAAIQAARLGARVVIVESTPWLGGMISTAGVSATDGNHQLPSGIWAEFRNQLYKVYGGPKAVETGWVSNTLFEPHVADSIFKKMAAAEKNLTVFFNHTFDGVSKENNRLQAVTFSNRANGEKLIIRAKTFIDATELGDVMKATGVAYDLGMEADSLTGEKVGITQTSSIVQDLTYVAVLKDYGPGTNHTIARPAGYDPSEFDAACIDYYKDKTRRAPSVDAKKMLQYGKLPHNKYMINWPLYGNDTYLNIVEMNEAERQKELVKAKETTRRFVYFIQKELGFKNLGLADDEFPTKDGLALIPYHREGRRVKGMVRFTMRHIAEPFTYGDPLYRTGISVGDYPIDHHHKKNLSAPQHLEFYPIPSFNVPLGALIPQNFDNLIIAEKGISVSNVANGTTRLQPCVMLTGQAAGVLAALSVKDKKEPRTVAVRSVQTALLNNGAFIMPYVDVAPSDRAFKAIQKIGATGILKGSGMPDKWANKTYFYPQRTMSEAELIEGMASYYDACRSLPASGKEVTMEFLVKIIKAVQTDFSYKQVNKDQGKLGLSKPLSNTLILNRSEIAILIDHYLDPFSIPVQLNGHLVNKKQ